MLVLRSLAAGAPCTPSSTRLPPQVAPASGLHLGADATLVIGDSRDLRIESLDLRRGTLLLCTGGAGGAAAAADAAAAGEPLVVSGLEVDNAGWEWQALDPDAGAAEEEYIRGFRVVKKEQTVLV